VSNKALMIIDVQMGFINEHTKHVPEAVEELIPQFKTVVSKQFYNMRGSIFDKNLKWNKMATHEDVASAFDIPVGEQIIFYRRCAYSGAEPSILEYLRRNKIDTVHLCGISTRSCVLATAFDLFDAGFKVKIEAQACGSTRSEADHRIGLYVLQANIDPDIDVEIAGITED